MYPVILGSKLLSVGGSIKLVYTHVACVIQVMAAINRETCAYSVYSNALPTLLWKFTQDFTSVRKCAIMS